MKSKANHKETGCLGCKDIEKYFHELVEARGLYCMTHRIQRLQAEEEQWEDKIEKLSYKWFTFQMERDEWLDYVEQDLRILCSEVEQNTRNEEREKLNESLKKHLKPDDTNMTR